MEAISYHGRILHLALRLLICVALDGCDFVRALTLPRWPDPAAVQAFDIRDLETDRATQIAETMMFAWGIWHICGDSPLPPDVYFDSPAEVEGQENDVGQASLHAVLAKVERLHPGVPENPAIAERIWRHMLERASIRGASAAKTRGCEATQPEDSAAWRALRSWRPVAQPVLPWRWHDR